MKASKRPAEPVRAQLEDIPSGVVENVAVDDKLQEEHYKMPKSLAAPKKTAALTKF